MAKVLAAQDGRSTGDVSDGGEEYVSAGLGDAEYAACWHVAGDGPRSIEDLADAMESPRYPMRFAVERKRYLPRRPRPVPRRAIGRRRPRRTRVGRRARARSPGREQPEPEAEPAAASRRAA